MTAPRWVVFFLDLQSAQNTSQHTLCFWVKVNMLGTLEVQVVADSCLYSNLPKEFAVHPKSTIGRAQEVLLLHMDPWDLNVTYLGSPRHRRGCLRRFPTCSSFLADAVDADANSEPYKRLVYVRCFHRPSKHEHEKNLGASPKTSHPAPLQTDPCQLPFISGPVFNSKCSGQTQAAPKPSTRRGPRTQRLKKPTAKNRKLQHDRPPIPNQRKKNTSINHPIRPIHPCSNFLESTGGLESPAGRS